MLLEVLGPHGGELPGCRSTCFLVDGVLALDAGALTSTLPLDALVKIDDVLLTHSHFDHVKDLPLLADVLVGRRDTPVTIWANAECIATLRENLFNDVLWPDFTRIPSRKAPVFRLKSFKSGATVKIGRFTIKSVPVTHPVESCGFVVSDGQSAMAMSGDTGPTEAFWKVLNARDDVKVLLLETSFPNALQALADVSGHFTPQTMHAELSKFDRRGCEVLIYHLKPAFVDLLKRELRDLPVHVCEEGERFEF
ncbi:MAG: 3',5'-cyclic-nucleotide phosphodiesterase [Myxococcaceae bacterium]|nr:3',5'-cyclic-nucleotide phosphodiesterase [Myxococcaceae bacterium]